MSWHPETLRAQAACRSIESRYRFRQPSWAALRNDDPGVWRLRKLTTSTSGSNGLARHRQETTSGPRTLPRQELTGSREKRKAPDPLQTETSLAFLLPFNICKPVPKVTRPVCVQNGCPLRQPSLSGVCEISNVKPFAGSACVAHAPFKRRTSRKRARLRNCDICRCPNLGRCDKHGDEFGGTRPETRRLSPH